MVTILEGIELDSEWRDRAGLNGYGEPNYTKHRTPGHIETKIAGDTRADWSEAVPRVQVAYVWDASAVMSEALARLLRIGFVRHQRIIRTRHASY